MSLMSLRTRLILPSVLPMNVNPDEETKSIWLSISAEISMKMGRMPPMCQRSEEKALAALMMRRVTPRAAEFRSDDNASDANDRVQVLFHRVSIPAFPCNTAFAVPKGVGEELMTGFAHHQGHLQVDIRSWEPMFTKSYSSIENCTAPADRWDSGPAL